MFELRDAMAWLRSARLYGDPDVRVTGVSTDTRAIAPGDLFVALRGERFDAHDFLSRARELGAAALLYDRWRPGIAAPAIEVPDARQGLGEIAAGWRRRFALPVIAVAGSNGKTTVKDMVASILACAHGAEHRLATRGNLNNDIGVPLTVLRLRGEHRAAVVELGMNRPGEIAWLARIAAPTVALVNNAQREHQEFMGSVAATARENGAAIEALGDGGIAVFPGDDSAHAPIWRTLAGDRRCIEFGLEQNEVSAAADARPEGFDLALAGQHWPVRLQIDGAHNVRNALAAAACTLAAGVSAPQIVAGLQAFRPAAGRLERRSARSGAALIDDSYNANPDSVLAAIDVLGALPEPRVLVLGDMAEVGDDGPAFHREVGQYARARAITHLLALGEATRATVEAFGDGAQHFDTVDALCERAETLAVGAATTLVKGSRSMRMERVVAALSGEHAGVH